MNFWSIGALVLQVQTYTYQRSLTCETGVIEAL